MSTVQVAAPVSDRFEILDALRGFALLGVLLANIHGNIAFDESQKLTAAVTSQLEWTTFLHLAVIDGKFYTLFSLMFGIGFAVILSRLSQRNAEALTIFRRRLWVLMGIGLLHMSLLYYGDILLLYALLGFVLVACRNLSDRTLLIAAMALILFPIVGYSLFWIFGFSPQDALYSLGVQADEALSPANSKLHWLKRTRMEGLQAFWEFSLPGPFFRFGDLIANWRVPKVLGIFLLGLWTGRRLVAGTLLNDRALLKRICRLGLMVGIPGNFLMATMGANGAINSGPGFSVEHLQYTVVYAFAVVPLALAYGSGFVLLWQAGAERWLRVFAPVGRMALTNYLSHSLFYAFIFTGLGLGLMGRLTPLTIYGIALAIFAWQLLSSRWWLQHFPFGPMEWLWRSLTYGRRMPFQRPRT